MKVNKFTRVKNIVVRDVIYNLDVIKGIKNKEALLSLLSDKVTQKISFRLSHTSTSISNALRRVVLTELRVKVLDFDVSEVETKDKEIILAELRDRISFIPIDQEIPLDTIFSLNFSSENIKQEYALVRSGNLVQVGGKQISPLPFSKTFRLIELRPGRFIEIPRISVIEGHGYEHAKFSLTSEFKYQVRDFVSINFLNEKGNIVKNMVKKDELLAVMKEKKVTCPGSLIESDGLYNLKILVIRDKSYQSMMDKNTLKRVKLFTVILEDVDLRCYSSLEVDPQEFFLEFTTYGNIDPVKMLIKTCDNLIERLEYFSDENHLVIQSDSEKTRVLLKSEDHTIGALLKQAIFKLDPSIGLINFTLEHPQIRTCTINMIHPNPMKIFYDAIKMLVQDFQGIKEQFSSIRVDKIK